MDKANCQEAYFIIGGTFDPVHLGHMALAEKVYSIFRHTVNFIPTAIPNYKPPPKTTAIQRLDMLNLALKNNQHFAINNREMFLKEYIPTATSLKKLRHEIGNKIPIYFLIGGDSLITLDSWDNWQTLFDLTNFIVAMRPGYELNTMSEELKNEYDKRITTEITYSTSGDIYILDFDPMDISSTKIRNNIANNKSVANFISPEVNEYIVENKLYLNKIFC